MNALVNYFIEANFGLIFFIGIYWLFLRNESQFSFNRVFLLTGIALSLSLPLLRFNSPSSEKVIPSLGQLVPSYWLPEVTIQVDRPGTPADNPVSVWRSVEWIYLIAATIFALVFIIRLGRLTHLILRSRKYHWNSCVISESEEEKLTFSFFKFIFIGQANLLTLPEKEEVLNHEWVHVSHYHSLDILLINVLEVIFWFNPCIRGYKKLFVQLHEFEADAYSVKNHEVDRYCHLLAKVALQSSDFSLVSHFNSSLTLKRITMMKTMKKKISHWKIAALIVAVPLFFFTVSCQDQVTNGLQSVGQNPAATGNIPSQVQAQLDALQQQNPDKKYIVIQMNDKAKITLDHLKFDDAKTSSQFPSMTLVATDKKSDGGGSTYVIIEDDRHTGETSKATISKDNVPAFSEQLIPKVAEQMPEFVGGMPAMIGYLQKEIKYPEDSRKAGVQGKVFVESIVDKTGDVIHPKILKGVNAEIDKEALRVVSGFPKWVPASNQGEVVSAKYVLPINFSL